MVMSDWSSDVCSSDLAISTIRAYSRSGARATGTPAHPLGMQQRGQEPGTVLGHVQDSLVCNTHQAQNLYEVDLGRTTFIPRSYRFCVFPLHINEFGVSSVIATSHYSTSPKVTRESSVNWGMLSMRNSTASTRHSLVQVAHSSSQPVESCRRRGR